MNTLIKIPFFAINERTGRYKARRTLTEDQIIKAADSIIKKRVKPGYVFTGPDDTKGYCRTFLSGYEHEVFIVLFLDNQHCLIKTEILSEGTIDSASVHPREVVKRTLANNAAAVMFAHNHPSGMPKPSQADIAITKRLTKALGLIDVRVLDHFIAGYGSVSSFAENGLM